eukprot:3021221-Rhodomonas_salina.1
MGTDASTEPRIKNAAAKEKILTTTDAGRKLMLFPGCGISCASVLDSAQDMRPPRNQNRETTFPVPQMQHSAFEQGAQVNVLVVPVAAA